MYIHILSDVYERCALSSVLVFDTTLLYSFKEAKHYYLLHHQKNSNNNLKKKGT